MRPLVFGLFAMGCSAGSGQDSSTNGFDDRAPTSSSAADTAAGSSVPPPFAAVDQPVYWSLSGQLVLSDGQVDLTSTALNATLWDETVQVTCNTELPLVISGTLDTTAPESVETFGWFGFSVDAVAPVNNDCGWEQGTLEVGIGVYNGLLDPALDRQGLLNASLYGLYIRESSALPVFLVGVAGTAEMFAGDTTAVAAGPLPDGSYQLQSLILLDL